MIRDLCPSGERVDLEPSARATASIRSSDRLSEYVRLAASGERVLVTDRDRVVAELVAPQSGTAELSGDALLAEAVRSGWLKPPVLPASGPPPRGKPLMTLEELLRDLDESRADRT